MQLSSRLILLVAALFAAAAISIYVIHAAERAEQAVLTATAEAELERSVRHWVDLTGTSMKSFVEDYSWWDDLVEFVRNPDPDWAEENFEGVLELWNLSALWVFDPAAAQVHHRANDIPGKIEFPVEREALWEICQTTPFPHFFRRTSRGVLEIRGAPIQPGDDDERTSRARGWLMVGRLWNEDFLTRLAPADDRLHLQVTNGPIPDETNRTKPVVHAHLPLMDENDRIVAVLVTQRDHHGLAGWREAGWDETTLMMVFAVGSIGLITAWLGFWVVRPVRAIDQALRTHSAAPIERLSKTPDEFGEIARLIIDSFAQAANLRSETEQREETEIALRESEETLRQMLEDRTRLGLDLHDSTIQTLYASGMSLVAVENHNPDMPEQSKQIIRDVRRHLQATIDELRRFIGQSETTILANSVSESIQLMLTFLRNTSQVQIETEIDEIPNDRLQPKQGMHLLQVLRESVTNALRHARASVITVQVQVRPGLVRLRVEDDGVGLPPHSPEAPSQGMLNMHQRAELAEADLEIKSRPDGGTRIDLSFHTA